jgi:hypothetical protein
MAHNPLESNLEARLRKGVQARGGRAMKLTKLPGFPDRLVLFPGGRVVFVEMKRPKGGAIAEHQALAHEILRGMGFEVKVLWTRKQVDEWIAAQRW